jgi:hypothetical protein
VGADSGLPRMASELAWGWAPRQAFGKLRQALGRGVTGTPRTKIVTLDGERYAMRVLRRLRVLVQQWGYAGVEGEFIE